jgi:coenzyme F420-reducing hydrogenase delta subunit
MLTEVLRAYGIDEQRFWLRWIAASDGNMLQEITRDMTEKLRALGPSPVHAAQMAG